MWKQKPEHQGPGKSTNENEEQIPCSSPERKGRTGSQDASGHIGMEASPEQSAQSINPAKLSLGSAPDAHMSREAQGNCPSVAQ